MEQPTWTQIAKKTQKKQETCFACANQATFVLLATESVVWNVLHMEVLNGCEKSIMFNSFSTR